MDLVMVQARGFIVQTLCGSYDGMQLFTVCGCGSYLNTYRRKYLIELFHVDGSAQPQFLPETAIFISGSEF